MLDELNEPQRRAVEHDEGPLLILAGAGSGKTRVVTHRIAHLIADGDIPPDAILAVTFTNRAAEEMRERVADLLAREGREEEADEPTISTFHSLGARLIRWHPRALGLDWGFSILDQDDQSDLVGEVAERLGRDTDRSERRQLRRYIEGRKNRGMTPRQAKEAAEDGAEASDAEFYAAYQEVAREANCVDFGDLLLKPLELFRREPDLADSYSRRWRYLMVDEFQDTNPAQYELLEHLTEAHRNLAVVGDDDQAIYRWRDATVENILEFDQDFEGTRVVKLEQNYRSTERILDAAHAVIQQNPRRREKELWTDREEGAPLTCFTGEDAPEEAAYVADEIQRLVRAGADWDDFAVFYRTNAQARRFEEQFRSDGIPYRVVGGVGFYGREEIKDVLAYLRLALNPADDVSLLRIVGKPTRGVGDKTVEKLREATGVPGLDTLFDAVRWAAGRTDRTGVGLETLEASPETPAEAEALETLESIGGRPKGGLRDFCDLVVSLREHLVDGDALAELVERLLERTNYVDWITDRDPERAEDRERNIAELMGALREFDTHCEEGERSIPEADEVPADDLVARAELGRRLRGFLERSTLVQEAEEDEERQGVVTMMTMHGAKGLEFETVFLTGMEEELFPNVRDDDGEAELYEERRLAYVAITRAEDKLYVTNAQRRRLYGQWQNTEPSRFLLEIDRELIEIANKSAVSELDYASKRRRRRQRRQRRRQVDVDELTFDQSRLGGAGGNDGYEDAVADTVPDRDQDYYSQVPTGEPDDGADEGAGEAAADLVGAKVEHSSHGIGEVLAVSGSGPRAKLTIDFPMSGEQTVIRKYVRLIG